MFSRISAVAVLGVDPIPIEVEVQIISALKKFSIVGLPDGVLREAKDRVRCAISSSGFTFPTAEVVVNLRPASIPKVGPGFDLAIALAILMASAQIPKKKDLIVFGELALDGRVKGFGSAFLAAAIAKDFPYKALLAPAENRECLALMGVPNICLVPSLEAAALYVADKLELPSPPSDLRLQSRPPRVCLSSVRGQQLPKRALQIAMAGGHNLLFCGAPGAGKSLLAESSLSILPPLEQSEMLEVAKIKALSGESNLLRVERPFRAPHYSTSMAGLIGGGSHVSPGEVSLAHRGVLFLDELPEFRREALEALRQPLETRDVVLSRARHRVRYPADFILLAAMNPCPCGKLGVSPNSCHCSTSRIERYLRKLSGPLLDRFDMRVWVQGLAAEELLEPSVPSDAQKVCDSIQQAREIQSLRWGAGLNSSVVTEKIEAACELSTGARSLLKTAIVNSRLSARGYAKVLKIARTIADLDKQQAVMECHVAEALSHRVPSAVEPPSEALQIYAA